MRTGIVLVVSHLHLIVRPGHPLQFLLWDPRTPSPIGINLLLPRPSCFMYCYKVVM